MEHANAYKFNRTEMKQVAVSNDCLRQRKFATGVT